MRKKLRKPSPAIVTPFKLARVLVTVRTGLMREITLVLAVVGAAALAACGGGENPAAGGSTTQASTSPAATTAPAASTDAEAEFGSPTEAQARANIFGAGRDEPPDPGGGGGGVLPPVWQLPARSSRIVTLPSVTGKVIPITGHSEANGPEGDGGAIGTTDVKSFKGISGIVDRRNRMFLVGVFLTDAPPSNPAPPRLDFTNREEFDLLEPSVGQTFFVGNGKGRRYRVPPEATRLFLGFADAYFYEGDPGYYNNNFGHLNVTVDIATE